MARSLLAALGFCLLTGIAHALPLLPAAPSPGEQCRAAIVAAERGHAIPPQLLAAIGRVESGKRDPGTGTWGAWPWTINAEGQGSYFETKAEAISAVERLQARGVRSIDVGCMQVNLMHHRQAFPSLDLAFEPATNADYAARFLLQLYGQYGDWTKATASYHSANPAEGDPYAAKVTSIWPEEQRKAGLMAVPRPEPGRIGQFARVQPFPGRQPPRMMTMAGLTSGGLPMGVTRIDTTPSDTGLPRVLTGATSQNGTLPAGPAPGQIMLPAMMQAGTMQTGAASGQAVNSSGRGLAFYRAMPIAMASPFRVATRTPYGAIR